MILIYVDLFYIIRYYILLPCLVGRTHVTPWFLLKPNRFPRFPETIGFQSFGAYMEKKIEHMFLGKDIRIQHVQFISVYGHLMIKL